MKHIKLISIFIGVICTTAFGSIQAQNVRGYYYAGGKQHWWTDDSTSMIVIIADTSHLFNIAHTLEKHFKAPGDEILYDNEDDNIMISSVNLTVKPRTGSLHRCVGQK